MRILSRVSVAVQLALPGLILFSLATVSTAAARVGTSAASLVAPHAAQQVPAAPPAEVTSSETPTPQPRITAYSLPPDRDKKARALSKVLFRTRAISLFYGFAVLWVVLRLRLAPKFRDVAEKASAIRFVQVLVFTPLIVLVIDILSLPTGIYDNWIHRLYGISVQGWGSWFWDWTKGEIISVILSVILIWILYAVIRKSPTRWWFYFWMASLPIILAIFFLQPLVIDPLFHEFEPLQQKNPALTAALERMVQRAGQAIPPERMFWMGAGEKTTALNAYVTGFGASKRIVVWDTTIAKMDTPEIVFVAGHEMGHYVLHHIPKGLAFFAVVLLITFYVGYRLIGWLLAKRGAAWGIRGVDDLASLPALLLLLSLIAFVIGPILTTFSRHQEHQADQYALEVTHGLTPDSSQVGAQSFNILGDVNLADPDPSPVVVYLFYDHPAIPDRVRFCLSYDPWGKGEKPEFVK